MKYCSYTCGLFHPNDNRFCNSLPCSNYEVTNTMKLKPDCAITQLPGNEDYCLKHAFWRAVCPMTCHMCLIGTESEKAYEESNTAFGALMPSTAVTRTTSS